MKLLIRRSWPPQPRTCLVLTMVTAPASRFAHTLDPPLHPVVIRPAAAFRWHPGDDLIRVGNVAGLTVDTVGWVQADPFAVGLGRVVNHFVDVGWTEILAGAAVLLHTTRVTDVGVVDDQVRGLVFLMLGAGVVKVGEFVERKLAVAFGRAE